MKPAVSFSLDDSVIKSRTEVENGTLKQLPKEHKFVVNSVAMQTLAVFSHTKGDAEATVPIPDKLALEGNVVQRAECRPISNNLYMGLKKEAIIKAIEPTRKTIQIGKVAMAYKPINNHASNIAYDQKKKAEGKKSRADKEVVMERLFALFEKHQYYNIKDLMIGTKQPITYLKEILKEVCSYSMKNPHKNMWELKPEYRHYKVDKPEDEPGEAKESDSSDSSDDE